MWIDHLLFSNFDSFLKCQTIKPPDSDKSLHTYIHTHTPHMEVSLNFPNYEYAHMYKCYTEKSTYNVSPNKTSLLCFRYSLFWNCEKKYVMLILIQFFKIKL